MVVFMRHRRHLHYRRGFLLFIIVYLHPYGSTLRNQFFIEIKTKVSY